MNISMSCRKNATFTIFKSFFSYFQVTTFRMKDKMAKRNVLSLCKFCVLFRQYSHFGATSASLYRKEKTRSLIRLFQIKLYVNRGWNHRHTAKCLWFSHVEVILYWFILSQIDTYLDGFHVMVSFMSDK